MIIKLTGCTTDNGKMRFREFALRVFIVFIKAINDL